MVESKDILLFQFMTYGYSGILNALATLGLNTALVARTASHDMKPKIREMLKQMLGGKTPHSLQDVAEIVVPFLNETFGLGIELDFPQENLARCKMNNCMNRPLALKSLAEGNQGCPLCMGAFMASLTISAFDVAEIDQFHGKANPNYCTFEIKVQK